MQTRSTCLSKDGVSLSTEIPVKAETPNLCDPKVIMY